MAVPPPGPAPNADPNVRNFAVIDRMRELAKWLIVLLGSIGGVLIAGSKLTDLGSTHGWKLWLGFACVGLTVAGVGIAIAFTFNVLMPRRGDLSRLVREGDKSVAARLVREEPSALPGRADSIAGLQTELNAKITEEEEAEAALEQSPEDPELAQRLAATSTELQELNEELEEFLGLVILEEVAAATRKARTALLAGGLLAVIGITVFAWATHSSDSEDAEASPSEAVPTRLSAVVVRLTTTGREEIAGEIGPRCANGRMRAIALGGTSAAIEMTTVPSTRCRAADFTLSSGFGSVINEKRLPALRACRLPRPLMPCIVYPNSSALVVAEP